MAEVAPVRRLLARYLGRSSALLHELPPQVLYHRVLRLVSA